LYGATRSEFPRASSMGYRKRQFLVVTDSRFAFANKDDTSPPVLDHSRHDEPRQLDRSKGINLQQPPYLIRRDVQRLCRGRVGDPCVIDEDIDATECLDRSIDNRRQVLFVGEIGCRKGRTVVTFANSSGFLKRGRVRCGQEHPMASSQQGRRHRATKTPPDTCYQSCTPGYLVLRQEWSSNNHLEPSLRSGPIATESRRKPGLFGPI
jgi:hypothetical protein